ncbi:hypothetical protein [Shewanella aestuarii]|uniref:Outer membrane insertion C-signal n=1 Tax=Shewanella aestuarii TaxID=1028752 RepID=A0A6G9QKQ0_9GAMM|nr:hypothetical protein [Shewanella aestuarii]QIR14968.1 hypothetical protein HBH39_11130 [Shewanella aestuarii]
MKHVLTAVIVFFATLSSAQAQKLKLGFGFDQGFGVTGQVDNINFFVGNDGASGDYLFKQGQFDTQEVPMSWYIGGGAFFGWDHGYGIRMPFGLNFKLGKGWDAYAQVAPELDFDDKTDLGLNGGIGFRYAF